MQPVRNSLTCSSQEMNEIFAAAQAALDHAFEEQAPRSIEIPVTVDLGALADAPTSYLVHDQPLPARPLRRGAVVRTGGGFAAFVFMVLLTTTAAGMMLAAIAYFHLDEQRPALSASAMSTASSVPMRTTSTEATPFVVAPSAVFVVAEPAHATPPSNASPRVPGRRASSPAAKPVRSGRAAGDTDTRLAMAVAANPY